MIRSIVVSKSKDTGLAWTDPPGLDGADNGDGNDGDHNRGDGSGSLDFALLHYYSVLYRSWSGGRGCSSYVKRKNDGHPVDGVGRQSGH